MKKITALAIAGVFTASLAATAFAESDVKVGGEIRVRHVEVNNNGDFNNDNGDASNTTSQRTRVNVDAKVNETTKAFIQLQDTRTWGLEASTASTGTEEEGVGTGAESVDLAQGYVQLDQLFGQPLSLRLGRQILAYGDHRLIGSFEWSDNARRFDALKLMYNTDAFSADLFFSNIGEVGVGTDTSFNGLYATLKMIPMNSLDLYLLQKSGTAKLNVLTYGARLNGGAMNIDWTAEAAMQNGDKTATVKREAMMYAIKGGYTLPEVAGLRIGAEYDFASGDDGSDATKDKSFDNLYPTNHPLYGVMDMTLGGRTEANRLSDLKAFSINVGAKPAEGLKLLAEYWNFSTDKKYNAGGDTAVGTEMNLQAWYALSKNVNLHGFIAQFTTDSKFADAFYATKKDAATNVTLQLAVNF